MTRVALALVACLLLAGCAGGDAPRALPVPTPTVTASQAVPALPAPRETGVAGEVEKAVLAYYAGINEASATGDTSRLRTTYTGDCAACETFADRLDGLRSKGQRLDGAQDVVTDLRVLVGAGPAATAVVEYTITAHRLLDQTGKVLGTFPSSEEQSNLALVRQPAGAWLVVDSTDALA